MWKLAFRILLLLVCISATAADGHAPRINRTTSQHQPHPLPGSAEPAHIKMAEDDFTVTESDQDLVDQDSEKAPTSPKRGRMHKNQKLSAGMGQENEAERDAKDAAAAKDDNENGAFTQVDTQDSKALEVERDLLKAEVAKLKQLLEEERENHQYDVDMHRRLLSPKLAMLIDQARSRSNVSQAGHHSANSSNVDVMAPELSEIDSTSDNSREVDSAPSEGDLHINDMAASLADAVGAGGNITDEEDLTTTGPPNDDSGCKMKLTKCQPEKYCVFHRGTFDIAQKLWSRNSACYLKARYKPDAELASAFRRLSIAPVTASMQFENGGMWKLKSVMDKLQRFQKGEGMTLVEVLDSIKVENPEAPDTRTEAKQWWADFENLQWEEYLGKLKAHPDYSKTLKKGVSIQKEVTNLETKFKTKPPGPDDVVKGKSLNFMMNHYLNAGMEKTSSLKRRMGGKSIEKFMDLLQETSQAPKEDQKRVFAKGMGLSDEQIAQIPKSNEVDTSDCGADAEAITEAQFKANGVDVNPDQMSQAVDAMQAAHSHVTHSALLELGLSESQLDLHLSGKPWAENWEGWEWFWFIIINLILLCTGLIVIAWAIAGVCAFFGAGSEC